MSAEHGGLSDFQLELAQLFFSLPESTGFLLAGGSALIAQGPFSRETDDLDFFTQRGHGDVAGASEALLVAAATKGWSADIVRTGPEFRRLKITGPGVVLIDLAVDSPPSALPTITIAGPSLTAIELAVRKTSHCSVAPNLATSPTYSRSPSSSIATS